MSTCEPRAGERVKDVRFSEDTISVDLVRPIAPVDINLTEGQKVRLLVEPVEKPDDVLALAAQVYEGLSDDQIDSIEQHGRRRKDFF